MVWFADSFIIEVTAKAWLSLLSSKVGPSGVSVVLHALLFVTDLACSSCPADWQSRSFLPAVQFVYEQGPRRTCERPHELTRRLSFVAAAQFVFGTCAAGAVVLTVNVVLLGGNIGFFQSMCLLGYCLFPMDVAAIVTACTTNMIARWIVVLVRRASLAQCSPAPRTLPHCHGMPAQACQPKPKLRAITGVIICDISGTHPENLHDPCGNCPAGG